MNLPTLQYITQEVEGKSYPELIEEVCKAGCKMIQLRIKNQAYEQILVIAREVSEICKRHQVIFIINDNVEICREVSADGVHLGKEDMSIEKAYSLLGVNKIIGATANTLDDVLALNNKPITYIGLGPFKYTKTKENLSPILGLEGYKRILGKLKDKNIHIPLFAVGGIELEDLSDLWETGIERIAVSGLINRSRDIRNVISEIKEVF